MIVAFRGTPGRIAAPALALMIAVAAAPLVGAAGAQSPAGPATAPSADSAAQEAAVNAALDARLPELKISGQTLDQALDVLRDAGKLNIVVRWPDLAQASVTPEEKLPALKLTNVRLRDALTAILKSASNDLDFCVQDNVITVATWQNLPNTGKDPVVRTYLVDDLLNVPSSHLEVGRDANGQATRAIVPDNNTPGDISSLMQVVETCAAPSAWRDRGGNEASMTEYKGALIVNAPEKVQEQVMQVLKQLRANLVPTVIHAPGSRAPGKND